MGADLPWHRSWNHAGDLKSKAPGRNNGHSIGCASPWALGFIRQDAPVPVFAAAVRAVSKGKVWLDRDLFRKIAVSSANRAKGVALGDVDERILYNVELGKTNKEIGAFLHFTERKVKAHVSNLLLTAGVPTRSGLTVWAIARRVEPIALAPAH
jgi:DNA-binding NarL/FixJ family response regulator